MADIENKVNECVETEEKASHLDEILKKEQEKLDSFKK